MKSFALLSFFGLMSLYSMAQNQVEIFENHVDIGKVLHPETATYNKTTQTYQLSDSGENIWLKKDKLHFAYRKTVGDFIATTQAALSGKGTPDILYRHFAMKNASILSARAEIARH